MKKGIEIKLVAEYGFDICDSFAFKNYDMWKVDFIKVKKVI